MRLSLSFAIIALVIGSTWFWQSTPRLDAISASQTTLEIPVQHQPWTTSRVLGSPDPLPPYQAEVIWPELMFDTAVDVVLGPDQRMYVTERWGKIWAFDPTEAKPAKTLFADLKTVFGKEFPKFELYGIAFHPDHQDNHQVFVRSILKGKAQDGSHIHRFKTSGDGADFKIDLSTEQRVLTFPSGGHNGGNIAFGADGYLYITNGDIAAPTPPDPLLTGQDISDLLACIMRIDVDHPHGDQNYSIPPDNPFVELEGARGEVWAYGFRNPWKIAFRPGTNDLWCGDVGWEQWEMIYRVEKGGNYGWSITEGPQPVLPKQTAGPTPIQLPLVAHPHTEAASITGGFFWNSDRLPELKGAYIYGDYMSGIVWAIWHDGTKITKRAELARTGQKIVAFAQDATGEVYLVDWGSPKSLSRLIPQTSKSNPKDFPRSLSQTGLFTPGSWEPAPGVYAYDVNMPQWRDGAMSTRLVGLPGEEPVSAKRERRGPSWRIAPDLPNNAVLARTFELALANGQTCKIETQLLHYSHGNWNGYSYRWNQDGSDAHLVAADGDTAQLTIPMLLTSDQKRTITWRFHSRSECARCHTSEAGGVLGFIPGQLALTDTLEQFRSQGVVSEEFASLSSAYPYVGLADRSASKEHKSRSWLHVNCAHCHRFSGGGSGAFRLNIETPTNEMLLIDALPQQGDFGLTDARLIAPGRPESSALLYRIVNSGSGHMPQLGVNMSDYHGATVIADWIDELEDHAISIDYNDLRLTSSGLHAIRCLLPLKPPEDGWTSLARDLFRDSDNPQVHALFDQFLTDDERKTLVGLNPDPQVLLSTTGDASRGATLFTKAQCASCHRAQGQGTAIGPDLDGIALRLISEQILESLLDPSKQIAPAYLSYTLVLTDGRVLTGLITEQTEEALTLKTAKNELMKIPRGDIEDQSASTTSLMPTGTLANLKHTEAADLLAYLRSLK